MKSSLFNRYGIHPHPLLVVAAAITAAFLNAVLHIVNLYVIGLPFFFDMIGTFFVTIFFGLIPGLITAVATHGCIELFQDFQGTSIPWVHISIASSLLIWFLYAKGKFHTLLHAISVTVFITFLNSILGAITAVVLYSGISRHPVDNLATGLLSIGHSLISSTFWARIPINLIDKGIAVFITFFFMKLFIAGRADSAEASTTFPEDE